MKKSIPAKDLGSLALDYCYLNKELSLKEKGGFRKFRFLAVPKKLLGTGLPADAILLYSLMVERLKYSVTNRWADEEGRVYIIYTAKEIMEELDCRSQKCAVLLKTLTDYGLIENINETRGKANRYLVKLVEDELSTKQFDNQSTELTADLTSEAEVIRKSNTIDTNNNYTPLSLTSTSNNLHPVDRSRLDEEKEEKRWEYLDDAEMVPTTFDDGSMGFMVVKKTDKAAASPKKETDEAMKLIADVLNAFAMRTGWMAGSKIRVNQVEVEREEVQKRLDLLTPQMIDYAAECIRRQASELMNPKSYALTALYNAPDTFPLYQSMRIKHEEDGEWYRELRARTSDIGKRHRELQAIGVA